MNPLKGTTGRASGVAFSAALLLGGCLLGACSLTGSQAASDASAEPQPASSGLPSPTGPAQASDESVGLEQQFANVKWGNGITTRGMDVGVPDPTGWYEAAFGPRVKEKILYLTYDDGPYPPTTNRVLKLLADNDAKATFFILGRQVDVYPGYVKKITAAGHALGNHTQDHENLARRGPARIRKQLTDVQQRVGSQLGNCMRPPGGFIDRQAGTVITKMGITPILWTGHAQDWAPPSADRMIRMLKEATSPGAVILLHDSADKEQTLAASAVMIPWWKKRGYRLETIPACRK